MQVFNDDVAGFYRRCNRYIVEQTKSASANVMDVNLFDQDRLQSYFDSMKTYLDWVMSQPQLDLPETHPKVIDLEPTPVIPPIENLMIRDVIRLFERCRDELINSQSARNATGLIKFDETRIRAVIEKGEKYLSDYIKKVTPIDMPESSPSAPDTGAGAGGINP